jgi:hypothetical protein
LQVGQTTKIHCLTLGNFQPHGAPHHKGALLPQ